MFIFRSRFVYGGSHSIEKMGEHCPDHFVEVSFLSGSSTHHFVDYFFLPLIIL